MCVSSIRESGAVNEEIGIGISWNAPSYMA
jgi:hypothetical protein